MADNTSTFVLKVKTEGLDQAQAGSQKVRDNLEGAQKAASTISAKSAASRSGGLATTAAITKASAPVEESISYNIARSAVGTGAAGRDFAKQSEGLGGLVRVYATFAANIYAVSAAFTALSSAMDTTNMVRGLDQLGAASGKNLGTLSKRLVDASDGAVSLREAMEATAKASSAGLNSAQILQMGQAAKKASQALGIDMTDALSRISRGISKLEPELLDELGIYVKIDDATQKYARSIGKTASSLSDFERRQAFANEVLAQANEKFGKIEIDANPYNKLLATFKNVAQTGLELVNKVLGPVVKLLSESPTALAVALAAIGSALLKQALPALGEFKENLRKAADDALVVANQRSKIAKEAGLQRLKDAKDEAEKIAEQEVTARDKASKKLEALRATGPLKSRARVQAILDEPVQLVKKEDLDYLQKKADENIGRNKALANSYLEVKNAIIAGQKAEADFAVVAQKLADARLANAKIGTNEWLLQQAAHKANKDAILRNIALTATENNQKLGFIASLKLAYADLAKARKGSEIEIPTGEFKMKTTKKGKLVPELDEMGKKIPVLEKVAVPPINAISGAFNFAKIAATGLVSQVSKLLGAFSWIGMAVAAATTIFEILDSVFSKNSKEIEAFNSALENTKTAGDLASNTLDAILKKDLSNVLSVESLNAKTNALSEVAKATSDLTKALDMADVKASSWDRFIDTLKMPFGKDLQAMYAKDIGYAISKGIDTIPEGPLRQDTEEKLKNILNVKDLSITAITNAVDKLPQDKVVAIGKEISEAMENAAKAARKPAEALAEVETALAKASKAFDDFSMTLQSSDPLSKFGSSLMESGNLMQKAFKDPVNALIELNNIVKDTNKLRLFSPESQKSLIATQKNLEDAKNKVAAFDLQIIQLRKDISEVPQYGDWNRSERAMKARETAGELKGKLETAQAGKLEAEAAARRLTDPLVKVAQEQLNRGMDLVFRDLRNATARASIAVNTAAISGAVGPGVAEATAELKRQELSLQISSINTMELLIRAQQEGALQQKLNTAQLRLNSITDTAAKREDPTLIAEANQLSEDIADMTVASKMVAAGFSKFSEKAFQAMTPGQRAQAAPFAQSAIQIRSERAKLAGQGLAIDVEKRAGQLQEQQAISQRLAQNTITLNNLELERVKLLTAGSDIINKDLLASKQQQEIEVERLTNDKAVNDIKDKILQQENRIKEATDTKVKDSLREGLQDLKNQSTELSEQLRIRTELSKIQRQAEVLKNNAAIEQRILDTANTRKQTAEELRSIQNASDQERIDYLTKIGLYSEKYSAERSAALSRESLELERQKQLREAEFEAQTKIAASRTLTSIQLLAAKTPTEQAQIRETGTDREKLINDQLTDRKTIIDATNRSKLISLNLTEQEKIKAAELKDITESLAGIFGTLGVKLSNFVTAISQSVDRQKAFNQELMYQKAIADDKEGDEQSRAGALKKIADLTRENNKAQLTDNIKLLNSGKAIFKEKTAAYKALDAIEKVQHLRRIVENNKELFIAIKNAAKEFAVKMGWMTAETTAVAGETAAQTAIVAAGNQAQAASAVPGIFAKFSAMMGPWGWAAAAAVVAALGLGGGSKSPPTGFTAEEQQKVQGTGQVYRDGKLVETGAGVLGDATAKSKSVENAIQNMEKYDFKNLEYSNKMLDALKAIRENTENFAGNILKAIPGINIKPETIKSGSFLSSETTEVLDQGIKIIGNVGQIIDQSAQVFKYINTKTTEGGLMGFVSGLLGGGGPSYGGDATPLGAAEAAPLKRDLSLIFKDIGGALGEAAKELGMGMPADIMAAFRSIDLSEQFKRISLMDLKPDEMVDAIMSVVSSGLDTAAMNLFPNLDKFRKAGESFGDTVLRIANDSKVVGLSFEELGMTLPRLAEQGAKPTTEQLNRLATAQSAYNAALAATKAVSTQTVNQGDQQLEIQVVGSEAATAALASALIELTAAQSAVTVATNSLTTNNIDLVQSYIKAAGSLDEFVERNRFFAENFLTEAERLVPVQDRVNKEVARLSPALAELGITSLTNRDQFKQAVFAAQALGASGVQLYTDLMKLAPAFAEVNKAMNDTTKSATELAQSLVSYLDDAFSLLNRGLNLSGELAKAKELLSGSPTAIGVNTDIADAKWISRQITMQDLAAKYAGKDNEIRLKNMTNLQKWVWALEDEKQARDDYVSALQTQVTVAQKEIAKLQKAIKVYDTLLDQRAQIDKLVNDTSTAAKDLARKNQLKGLLQGIEETELQYVSAITANQEYIWALEDEQAVKDKLIKQQDKLKATIQTLEGALKSIQSYRTGLLTGDLTVLTPEQQYQEAKAAFEKVATAARTPGTDEAGAALQQQAISDLPSAADKLLQMSRTLFGSSGGYQTDFKAIQNILDLTENQIGEQLTDAQQQIDLLQTQASFLKSIDESSQTTAQILAEYATAQDKVSRTSEAASTLNIDTINNLKTAAENRIEQLSKSIEGYQDKIAELTGQSITEQQATKIATTASAAYTNSIDATSKAYTELTKGIDGREILEALARRSEASQMISLGEAQVRLMEDTAANTAATNTNQNTQSNTLRTDPASLAPVTSLVPILTTIATNTAVTADSVDNVQDAVVNSSQANVRTNNANATATAAALEAVADALRTTVSAAPLFVSSAPLRVSFFTSQEG